jgi:VWFA-related protein
MPAAAQSAVRRKAVRFVDANASPDRYMAVVNFGLGLQIAQPFTTAAERLKPAVQAAQPVANISGMEANSSVFPNLMAGLKTVAESLARIRGRKAVVLIGAGYPSGSINEALRNAVIDACNKANVAIYAVDVAALVALPAPGLEAEKSPPFAAGCGTLRLARAVLERGGAQQGAPRGWLRAWTIPLWKTAGR